MVVADCQLRQFCLNKEKSARSCRSELALVSGRASQFSQFWMGRGLQTFDVAVVSFSLSWAPSQSFADIVIFLRKARVIVCELEGRWGEREESLSQKVSWRLSQPIVSVYVGPQSLSRLTNSQSLTDSHSTNFPARLTIASELARLSIASKEASISHLIN